MSDRPFRLGTFSIAGCRPFAGVVVGEAVVAASALAPVCAGLGAPLGPADTLRQLLQDWDANLAALRRALAAGVDHLAAPLAAVHIHAPIPDARQVFCAGANYKKHVVELVAARGSGEATKGMDVEERRAQAAAQIDARIANGEPYAWLKAPTAIAGPDDVLTLPAYSTDIDWELELAVVIGRPCFQVRREAALDHVAGYMIANDVTARDKVFRSDMKNIGTDWLIGKGAPGFLPCGPFLVPRAQVPDPYALHIRLSLNGQVMQDESVADMMFGIERLIEYISAHVRMEPGDVLCTGSPAGNGAHYGRYLRDGDVMTGSIEGLGTQTVRCVAERA